MDYASKRQGKLFKLELLIIGFLLFGALGCVGNELQSFPKVSFDKNTVSVKDRETYLRYLEIEKLLSHLEARRNQFLDLHMGPDDGDGFLFRDLKEYAQLQALCTEDELKLIDIFFGPPVYTWTYPGE